MAKTTKRTKEWGVRFGDGEIESCHWHGEAKKKMREAREQIKKGAWKASDYEPMTLMCREVVTTTGDWSER